ncbi:class I SAM-dependent methyltransferase [Phreatobacter cathodiphilus]|uniref:Methyltransferase n=1 Tax=Phreatobacter cathodiphilus TaxID=1868589 RepID=A0A2S0NA28_9HYPH|nr:SAM-dependent methyltransferase [Phreatobacter cathodiphilus]AVO44783.1 methyltransferase [Phreatobacter cathodiphilus]
MSALATELEALIRTEGPLPVDRFMALALGHPRHGYYMTRDPLGAAGDFVTAPEISQVFGELIGVWAAAAWEALGRPERVNLVELGPGRGTLMADMLRAAQALPAFRAALSVHLVETSPVLTARQQETLASVGVSCAWHRDLAAVPAGPAILVANEFLDALPIRQFVMTPQGWRERVVGLVDGALAFGLARDPVPLEVIPAALRAAPAGAVVEICPAYRPLAATLAGREAPLAALFVDYGHARSAHGETLQAVRGHRFADPLTAPGEADLTAHVDFEAFAAASTGAGLAAGEPVTQRALLFALGLRERAERLAEVRPGAFETIRAGVERLIDPAPAGMGSLFKAIPVASSPPLLRRLPT